MLLSSEQPNNLLLCEMALHPGFLRLMTDIEICVDQIADMHIRDMNQLLETARKEIIGRYSPGENDPHLRTLELAQASEDIFYKDVIYKDLDAIVRDLRTAHEKDSATADPKQDSAASMEQVGQMLMDALNYEDTIDQKRAYLVCQIIQIDYEQLSPEDQEAMARITRNPPVLASAVSLRGKGSPKGKKRK